MYPLWLNGIPRVFLSSLATENLPSDGRKSFWRQQFLCVLSQTCQRNLRISHFIYMPAAYVKIVVAQALRKVQRKQCYAT